MRDALIAINGVQSVLSTLRYEFGRFEREDLPRWALEWQLNILGQALRRIDPADRTLRTQVPEIREAIATQTAMSKRYDEIDNQLVWATAMEDMDPLRKAIQAALYEAGEPIT